MLTSDEQIHLREYVDLVRELRLQKFGQRILASKSITLRGTGDCSDAAIVNFDEDECRSFILGSRLLVQDNDHISIHCIWLIFKDRINDPGWFVRVNPPRWMLNDFLDQGALFPPIDDPRTTMRDIFYTFLWGAYAHRRLNPKFRERFLKWQSNPKALLIQKVQFALCLKALLEMAGRIESVVEEWLSLNTTQLA